MSLRKCTEHGVSGLWSRLKPTCADRCGPSPWMNNAYPQELLMTRGSASVFHCFPYHKFFDGTTAKTVSCNNQKQWTFIGHCEVEVCTRQYAPGNGILTSITAQVGVTIQAKCNEGYHYSDNSTVITTTCLSNLQWSRGYDDCKKIWCLSPPTISEALQTNIHISSDAQGYSYPYGSFVTFGCIGGRRFPDGEFSRNITCLGSGEWKPKNLTCQYGICPPVSEWLQSVSHTEAVRRGNSMLVSCEDGYIFTDGTQEKLLQCQGGVWPLLSTYCKEKSCPSIQNNPTWIVNTTETTYKSVVMVTCVTGYHIANLSFIVTSCNASGLWEDLPTECLPKDCGAAPDIVKATHPDDYNSTYLSQLVYTCDSEYWFGRGVFRRTIQCSENAVWRPHLTCKAVTCMPLLVREGISTNSSENHVGDAVNLTCIQGRYFFKHKHLSEFVSQCNALGEWMPEIPECVSYYRPTYSPAVVESEGSKLVGVLAVIIIVSVCLLIILVDLRSIYNSALYAKQTILRRFAPRPEPHNHVERIRPAYYYNGGVPSTNNRRHVMPYYRPTYYPSSH